MNNHDEQLNNLLSSVLRFARNVFFRKIFYSPLFWGVLILFFLFMLGFGLLFAFLGDAASDRTVQNNALRAKEIVDSVPVPVESYNKMEPVFALPYGIPYSIQLYARDWDDNMDERMVRNIAEDLKPDFEYFFYDEPTEVWESWYDAQGNYFSNHYTIYNKRKFIKKVNTYAGIFYPVYQIFESRNEVFLPEYNGKFNYHKVSITHFLAQTDLDFLTDWTRLDSAIIKYAYSNKPDNSAVAVETYEVSPGKMIYPFSGSYPVTSPFGLRIHPVYGTERFHSGVDFGTPLGTPILAVLDGVVVTAGPGGGYGNVVIVKHADGLSTVYAHLSIIYVKPGEFVKQGQVIALSGNTGVSTGPHLHFEVRKDGTPTDPIPYLGGKVQYAGGTIHYVPYEERMMIMETAFSVMGQKERFALLTGKEHPDIENPSPPPRELIDSSFRSPKEKHLIEIFNDAGSYYGIPPSVLMAVAYIGSDYNKTAVGVYFNEPNTALLGIMQLLPSVLREYGRSAIPSGVSSNINQVSPNINAFNEEAAIYTAAKYLRSLMDYYVKKGYSESDALRIALWRYNNNYSWWYADKVLSTAAKITGEIDKINRN